MRLSPGLYQNVSSVLLSLFLALLIWIAATNIELERVLFPTQGPGLPIQLLNQPDGLLVMEGAEQYVRVNLSIPRELVGQLQPSDLVAEADLAGLGPGVHQVAVAVRAQPVAPRFRLLNPTPDRIIVQLDEVLTRTLPVEVAIPDRSTIPQPYQMLTTTVEPPTITLVGPKSIIEPIKQVVAETTIDGARESLIREVTPQFIGLRDGGESYLGPLAALPVTVTVPIELRPGYKDLIVGTEIRGEPASGYWVSEVVVEPRLLTVVGQPDMIRELDSVVFTEPINVEGLGEGEITRRVELLLPEGVSGARDDLVEVRIRIEPQTSSKRVSLKPIVTGLEPGQVVTDSEIVPATVTVLLKGPITELEDLNLDEVVVSLDVSGRPLGTHLLTPRVQPPATLRAESVNPELVEVTIREEEVVREVEVPIGVRGLAPSLVALLSPPTLALRLRGPLTLLAPLDPNLIQPFVDVTRLHVGSYDLTPTFTLTSSLTLLSEPSPVNVRLYDEGDLIVLSEQLSLVNLGPELRATLSQAVVRLRVAGPGDATTLSQSPEFAVEVDMAGLGEGSHTLRPTVRLPSGYTLADVSPLQVEVILQPNP